MTTDCHACAEALLEPETGLVYVNCHGCNVRCVSKMPNFAREAMYATIPEAERTEFIKAVADEYRRRSEHRGRA